jgi:hypothetical protein
VGHAPGPGTRGEPPWEDDGGEKHRGGEGDSRVDSTQSIRLDGDQTPNPTHRLLTVKFRQPSHEFTFGVGMSFISYPLVLTPLV